VHPHRLALQLPLQFRLQAVVSRVHIAEFGRAQRPAVAPRDLDAVEHVGERDLPAVGHVRMPVLPGIGEADRSAVLDDVGKNHHLGQAGLLVGVGDIDFQIAELGTEIPQLGRG
jgi:hypothetical protein